MSNPVSDAELVAQVLQGRQEAYGVLVRRYERPVFSVVVRLVRDRELAEDISQEAFLRAYRFLDKYDAHYRFSSWIFRIAHNVTIDHLRKRRVSTISIDLPIDQGSGTLGDLLEDARSAPASTGAERANLAGALEGVLANLRPQYREVILLRFAQDLSYPEIAGVTGLPLGTVKTYIHRARKEMAEAMRAAGWSREDSS